MFVIRLLPIPLAGAAATALLLALPGWFRERSERSARRSELTDRLSRVYSLELAAAGVAASRFAVPVGTRTSGSGWGDLPPAVADDLTVAAEAFLSGAYREHLVAQDRIVPAWAWVNPLAHGALEDIEELAAQGLWASGPEAIVCQAAATISRLVRRDGVDLRALQEQALLPLEDRLAVEIPDPGSNEEVAHVLTTVLRRWVAPPNPA